MTFLSPQVEHRHMAVKVRHLQTIWPKVFSVIGETVWVGGHSEPACDKHLNLSDFDRVLWS